MGLKFATCEEVVRGRRTRRPVFGETGVEADEAPGAGTDSTSVGSVCAFVTPIAAAAAGMFVWSEVGAAEVAAAAAAAAFRSASLFASRKLPNCRWTRRERRPTPSLRASLPSVAAMRSRSAASAANAAASRSAFALTASC